MRDLYFKERLGLNLRPVFRGLRPDETLSRCKMAEAQPTARGAEVSSVNSL